jgi:hypothetical protein
MPILQGHKQSVAGYYRRETRLNSQCPEKLRNEMVSNNVRVVRIEWCYVKYVFSGDKLVRTLSSWAALLRERYNVYKLA